MYALRLLFVGCSQLHEHSAEQSSLSRTPAAALHSHASRSQARFKTNLSRYWLALPSYGIKSLVPVTKLYSGAEQLFMCFQPHYVSVKLGHDIHVVRVEHIILSVIIFSITSCVVRRFRQNEVYILTLILSDAKPVLLRQVSEIHVVDEVQGSLFLTSLLVKVLPIFLRAEHMAG